MDTSATQLREGIPVRGGDSLGEHVARANDVAVDMLCSAEPVLIDVLPARQVIAGLDPNVVLTSGAPLSWPHYIGGQRTAVLGGAVFEGLARDLEEADELLHSGEIRVAACQAHGCIGSLAGVTTPSMPVLVVEDAISRNQAYCTLFEGSAPARLNYGVYNDQVRESLLRLERHIAPTLREAVRRAGGVPLRPIIRRALHMGDELHSRNTAATALFTREILPELIALARLGHSGVDEVVRYLHAGDYFFLRLSMAAAKATVDRLSHIEYSTVVMAMAFSCREFAIRVAGLGDEWFRGPLPEMETGLLFEGHSPADVEFMGGESPIAETVGLGAFAQAAAFPLQAYQGGSAERMVETNLEMYEITLAEHPEYRIPYLGYRGVPVGIEISKVLASGVTPAMDIGIAGRGGGQIGAGCFRAPSQCFELALRAWNQRYSARRQPQDQA